MSALQDINGKESQKRKQGARFLTFTLAICTLYFIMLIASWFMDKDLFQFPFELVAILGSIGTTLLGVTVFEKVKS